MDADQSALIRVNQRLKIAATLIMPAITIELDRVARAFTWSTTIFAAGLGWAGTARIFALVLIVRHWGSSV